MERWEMKVITEVPAPFPVLHFMQYNAGSSRVQERHQEQIAVLAKMSSASSDDNVTTETKVQSNKGRCQREY